MTYAPKWRQQQRERDRESNDLQIHHNTYYGGSVKQKKGQKNEKEKIITRFIGKVTSPTCPH
jgi:hypothetical protein